ncbi:MAG: hypothetical protein N2578_08265 [Bdellovibrionaceae bacterium]|nr:hypothetical protein [Pseudobdellovibrionaceae bacterium]
MIDNILEELIKHANDYVDARNQINNYERDSSNGAPTSKGFKDIVEGFRKASNALTKISELLEKAQNENPNNQQLTDIQKSVLQALTDTNEKFKKLGV